MRRVSVSFMRMAQSVRQGSVQQQKTKNLLFFLFAFVARERLEFFLLLGFLLSLTGGHGD